MKKITYSLAIIALLLTNVSFNIEDIIGNNANATTTEIDPPMPMPLPM